MATLRSLQGLRGNSQLPVGYDNPAMSALVNAFLSQGHKVVVFTTSVGLDEPVIFAEGCLTVCVARRERHAARDLFRSERRELVGLMQQYPVDIINAHWSYEFAWAALDSGRPTLVTLRDHAMTVFRYQPDIYRFLRLIMNHYVLYRAPYLSVNSKYLFSKLPAKHQSKARIIQNAFSSDVVAKYTEYRNRGSYIVSVANGFGRRKNIDTALQAFKLLRKEWPELEYRLIGDGMEKLGEAEQYARHSGLAEGVVFMGRVPHDQVLECVRSAKLLLHPALEESFGMGVLEAMVVGTPVVGGESSGNIPALLEYGRVGGLCDVTNPQSIARSVSCIVREEGEGKRLADAAVASAHSRFSQKAIVSAYLDYYADIISKEEARREDAWR